MLTRFFRSSVNGRIARSATLLSIGTAPLPDGKTAVSLFLEETDPLIEFGLMNFLFCVHENLLDDIARNARIAQITRKYLES